MTTWIQQNVFSGASDSVSVSVDGNTLAAATYYSGVYI